MVGISEDLRDLVSSTINSVKEGLKEEKCRVSGTIKFEVSVAVSKEAKTGLKIFVVDASGNYTKDNISKITFEIEGVLSDSEKANLNNQINQLHGNLSSSNSKVEQLTRKVQTLNDTVTEQTSLSKQKSEEIEKLRKEVRDQTKQLTDRLSVAEKQRDNAISQINELAHTNKVLQDELSKNPRVIYK